MGGFSCEGIFVNALRGVVRDSAEAGWKGNKKLMISARKIRSILCLMIPPTLV
jgi:hypothetical protein